MEITLLILVGVLFTLLGAVCVFTVILGLPGTWIMLALALIINVLDPLYLSDAHTPTFGWILLIVCAALAGIGEVLEFIAGALGAKGGGSSKRGVWGALIGGIIGGITGLAIPVPIVGSLIGAAIGSFLGAIIGEISGSTPNTVRGSIKPATGAAIGRVLGTLSKLPIALLVWLALSVAVFWW